MQISKVFHLESSHIIPDHAGKCACLHGHSWTVEIFLSGTVKWGPGKQGYVLDYAELSSFIDPVVAALDHRHLNFFMVSPTAERLAAFFGALLLPFVVRQVGQDRPLFQDAAVQIKETEKTSAIWNSECPDDVEMAYMVMGNCHDVCVTNRGQLSQINQGPHEFIRITPERLEGYQMVLSRALDGARAWVPKI